MYVDDQQRIRHMLDAALNAIEFITGKSRNDLNSDLMLLFALVKTLEIIGEAARGISDEFKKNHHEIPWIDIIAMRNRLIHGYFDVDIDIVWNTVKNDVPVLKEKLEMIL